MRPKKLWLKPLHPQARDRMCAPELAVAQRDGVAAHAGVCCPLKSPQLQSLFETFQARAGQQYPIGAVLALVALGPLARGGAANAPATRARPARRLGVVSPASTLNGRAWALSCPGKRRGRSSPARLSLAA